MSEFHKEFRQALGAFATGVTIITTHTSSGKDIGVTASSFNSVSLDPPLVLWSIARSSGSINAFLEAEYFAVHVLSLGQDTLSNRFASRGVDKFEGIEVARGMGDAPLLSGCCAQFQCKSTFHYEGGDHIIIVGEVVSFEYHDVAPLLFHGGKYSASTSVSNLPEAWQTKGLHELLRHAYFKLLLPVRRERDELGIALEDHYILEVLLAGPQSTGSIDDLISYTGIRATEVRVQALIERDLLQPRGDGSQVELTPRGREVVVRLRGAAHAVQAEAAIHLGVRDLDSLNGLLWRVSSLFDSLDDRSDRHLRLLAGDLTG